MFDKIVLLVKKTIKEWSEDKAARLAAALAYYAAFSLAPMLVIAISVASLFFEQQTVQNLVIDQINGLAGDQGGELIATMLDTSRSTESNLLLGLIGVITLIMGATGVFGQIQDALNTMWEIAPKPGRGLIGMIKDRFLSFTMVVGVGFLLLISLVVSAALSGLENWGIEMFPGLEAIVIGINFVISFIIITVLFALVFKYVPDAEIAWKDVWFGASVTAALFTLGKFAIGLYLGNSSVAEQFGPAGSLMVLLLWVYYSAQISFFGAEFTQVYANTYGSRVRPAENAIPLTETDRKQQGIPTKAQLHEAAHQKERSAEN